MEDSEKRKQLSARGIIARIAAILVVLVLIAIVARYLFHWLAMLFATEVVHHLPGVH